MSSKPKLQPTISHTLEVYAAELKHLAMKILDYTTKALKMKAEDMRGLFEEGMQSMRMNYYPPCPQLELVVGLTPHSNSVGVTILLQLNEMEGYNLETNVLIIGLAVVMVVKVVEVVVVKVVVVVVVVVVVKVVQWISCRWQRQRGGGNSCDDGGIVVSFSINTKSLKQIKRILKSKGYPQGSCRRARMS
ncbi:hypothetical protein HYC85_018846 [Camellia sinensis]|uniref:Isopenicillin N synthase-like Fe(2+) 2OG dioxygenase domain-containing protein n=1 Tax=Camellia sinensis TaxID=4442 RepID=A0A7J7GVH8_CAMSI|nr:hypothetical protein HYC85_018846 [Camellia sinensis]